MLQIPLPQRDLSIQPENLVGDTLYKEEMVSFNNEISTQSVSIFEISISDLHLTFSEFLKYNISSPPVLSWTSALSFHKKSKPAKLTCESGTLGSKNVSHMPSMSGQLSVAITIRSSSIFGKR